MWLCVNGWNEKERDERKTLCLWLGMRERERERDEMKLIRGEMLYKREDEIKLINK